MKWKVEYETLDADLNPEGHGALGFDKIYVKREFTIDTPDSDTLFRVIDALKEGYLELRLRKIERVNFLTKKKKSLKNQFYHNSD